MMSTNMPAPSLSRNARDGILLLVACNYYMCKPYLSDVKQDIIIYIDIIFHK